jgi:serine/threonine protein kinase
MKTPEIPGYKIISKLDKESYSRNIWKAEREEDEKKVVIKIPKPLEELRDSPHVYQEVCAFGRDSMLDAEKRILQKTLTGYFEDGTSKTLIAPYIDSGELENGTPWLAQEFQEGPTVKEILHTLTLENILNITGDIASILQLIHSEGRVVRDHVLLNMICGSNPNNKKEKGACLYDMETVCPNDTQIMSFLRTPRPRRHLAPEIATNKNGKFNYATDWFTLGADILYMLAGEEGFITKFHEKDSLTYLNTLLKCTYLHSESNKGAYHRESRRAYSINLGEWNSVEELEDSLDKHIRELIPNKIFNGEMLSNIMLSNMVVRLMHFDPEKREQYAVENLIGDLEIIRLNQKFAGENIVYKNSSYQDKITHGKLQSICGSRDNVIIRFENRTDFQIIRLNENDASIDVKDIVETYKNGIGTHIEKKYQQPKLEFKLCEIKKFDIAPPIISREPGAIFRMSRRDYGGKIKKWDM